MDIGIEDRNGAGPLSVKAACATPEAVVTHAELMRAFEAFKAENDDSVKEIAKKGVADVVSTDKLARIETAIATHTKALETLSLRDARPLLDGERKGSASERMSEHKAAFLTYVRSGESSGLKALESKALSVGSNADGGYLVPDEVETTIGRRLATVSPIRALAGSRTVSSDIYKKPFMTSGPAVGWVGETDARPQTATPVLAELSFPAMELYAMPAATASLLDDSAVNIEEWLAGEVEQAFAEQEGTAFVTGDGVGKPKGFLAYPTVAQSAWSWGNIGHIATGAAGAFPASNPSDVLIDLIYAVAAGYRQNAVFVMNRKTQAAVRKFKDAQGNYLWSPPAAPYGKATLIGFPLADAEQMPDVAANSLSVAFGDFGRGYLVVDRAGVRVLRDPYSAKPYVLFYTTKRVGGGVQDFNAIKVLKFAAS
ncbi:phage major capsid protein [Xanthobacteraceae bacterium Astr-EGSB]|uniref:phage major capsid protein n=1 Tax=Astrobacterium formosum TaxID=3069710 RepID=UPI0027B05305|nr:phage major capsid protein [Xanthobacteraceae bacterium Astr-EGSB]